MAEMKQIGSISVVTDTETGMYHMGEVGGGFDDQKLKQHIKKYGHIELLETLAYMQYQVWQTVRDLNAEKDAEPIASKVMQEIEKL